MAIFERDGHQYLDYPYFRVTVWANAEHTQTRSFWASRRILGGGKIAWHECDETGLGLLRYIIVRYPVPADVVEVQPAWLDICHGKLVIFDR